MMKKIKLLFIDDENFYANDLIVGLESRYKVEYRSNIIDGSKCYAVNKDIGVIILDIMMPPPKGYPHSATGDKGQRTGLVFLEENLEALNKRGTPVFILTNRLIESFSSELEKIGLLDGFYVTKAKSEISYKTLPHEISSLLDSVK